MSQKVTLLKFSATSPGDQWVNCPHDETPWEPFLHNSGLILGLHLANERRRYKETPFLIDWVQT